MTNDVHLRIQAVNFALNYSEKIAYTDSTAPSDLLKTADAIYKFLKEGQINGK